MKSTFTFEGIDDWIASLQKISDTDKYIGKVIYEGAKVGAKELQENISKIPLVNGISEGMIEGLQESFGISKMQKTNGFWNVKLGFDGYNTRYISESHPEGLPNQMVANLIEHGTSYMPKHKFTKIAAQPIEDAMAKAIDNEIKKLT